jgi:hypothetical protein
MRHLRLLTPVVVAATFAPVGSLTLILVVALALDVLLGVLLAREFGHWATISTAQTELAL